VSPYFKASMALHFTLKSIERANVRFREAKFCEANLYRHFMRRAK
jgi:hypothetical protein